jgi:hypothetical protein
MLRRVALVRTDVSDERTATIIRVASHCNVLSLLVLFTLMMEVIPSSETSYLTRATQLHIQEDGTLEDKIVCQFEQI